MIITHLLTFVKETNSGRRKNILLDQKAGCVIIYATATHFKNIIHF